MTSMQKHHLETLVLNQSENFQTLINDFEKLYPNKERENDVNDIKKMIDVNNELLKELSKIKVKNDRIS